MDSPSKTKSFATESASLCDTDGPISTMQASVRVIDVVLAQATEAYLSDAPAAAAEVPGDCMRNLIVA